MKSFIVVPGLGAIAGFLLSLYWRASSVANLIVRPELGRVDFWTALLAGHGGDWLWYFFPDAMTVIAIIIGVFAGLLVAFWIRE